VCVWLCGVVVCVGVGVVCGGVVGCVGGCGGVWGWVGVWGGTEGNFSIFLPSFCICQEGLLWHLHALHSKFQMYEDRCCQETRRTIPTTVQESSLNIGGAERPSASIGGAIAPLAPAPCSATLGTQAICM